MPLAWARMAGQLAFAARVQSARYKTGSQGLPPVIQSPVSIFFFA
jgi:hypothetical protein